MKSPDIKSGGEVGNFLAAWTDQLLIVSVIIDV